MPEKATVHINKLAAAQRQLNAAIRMELDAEDELAIHTVAAAAYSILRDIKRKRGRRELSDMLARGIFYTARDLDRGVLTEVPQEIRASTELTQIIVDVAHKIRTGEIRSQNDVQINCGPENRHWSEFNKAANFLKHADADHEGLLSLDVVKNDSLIMSACAAYIDLGGALTPEMMAYYLFLNTPGSEEYLTGFPKSWLEDLAGREGTARGRACLAILAQLKASSAVPAERT